MIDRPDPQDAPLDDGAVVAAWLAGDLDAADADAVEERLAREPELAARADRVARALVALRRPDDVELTEGAAERLRGRLDEELAGRGPQAAGGEGPAAARGRTGGAAVADLAAARQRRRGWTLGLSAVAAGVVVLVGLGSVTQLVGDGDMAAETSGDEAAVADAGGDADAGGEGAARAPAPGGASSEMSSGAAREGAASEAAPEAAAGAAGEDAAAGAAPGVPVVVEAGAVLGDGLVGGGDASTPPLGASESAGDPAVLAAPALDGEVRGRYGALPEATALLGTPRADADALAVSALDAVRAAASFADGVRPDACVDAVLAATARGESGTPVLARVERATLDGDPVLVHVLVTGDGTALAATRVVVTDAVSCATRVDVTV